LHDNLSKVVDKSFDYPQNKHTFLLDESRFSFFRFDVFIDSIEDFSIQDLHQIKEEKIQLIENKQ
jgi:hypothetical protein